MNELGPDYYRDESTQHVIDKTKATIEHVRKIDPEHHLITPIITPRFAPACSPDCLQQLGSLHRSTGYPCQTHISENKNEVELVKQTFPSHSSYADVYDKAGLLTHKMVLAHAVHLTPDEVSLVKERNAKISHCPSSNTALTSGCTPVRKLLNTGIDIGLGTDVSGGFSASILEVARQAIWVSRHIAMTEGDEPKLSVEEVLYLATRGGAKVMNLENKVGGFEVGMEWDAQLISMNPVPEDREDLESDEAPVDIFGWEEWEDRFHKWLYGGDDRNTVAVWVRGRLVHSTSRFKQ